MEPKMKIGIRSMRIEVGPIPEEGRTWGRAWRIVISKDEYGAEPNIRFEGDPTLREFKKAFEVLAEAEIANQLKEAIQTIQKQMK